jgi:ribosomal protein S12 methylthiotransferase accessory factor
MSRRSKRSVPRQWLPFVGRKLGLAKSISDLAIDPDDFRLHHAFPATTALGKLMGYPGAFEPRAGGAGVELDDAINRAMGELAERYASLACDGATRIVSSHKALVGQGHRVVPFEALALFTREQLTTPGFRYAALTEDTPIGWLEGTDLMGGSPVYVPGELVSFGYVPGRDEVPGCFYPTSSGCACSNSIAGAVLAGLLELIERDAVMISWYARIAPPLLDFDPADLLGEPFGRNCRELEIRLHDLKPDGDVPVVGVTCVERTGRPCFFLLSAASGLDLPTAARKALIEAGQGRPFIKFLANQHEAPPAGSAFNDFDTNLRFFAEPSNAQYSEWFVQNRTVSTRHYPPAPDDNSSAGRLHALLDRCAGMKITPIAFDLTTPEMEDHGLFACKIFVPELVPLGVPSAPFLGHPRLAHFAASARREGTAEPVPAWVPHPFP